MYIVRNISTQSLAMKKELVKRTINNQATVTLHFLDRYE